VNAVVGFRPLAGDDPLSLLRRLRGMEREFGRKRGKIRNAPRPLDLDLIAFGSQMISTSELVLPHPRAHLRRFVLQPLNEIAPDFVLPNQTKSVRELLLSLPLA
jgi:2-amino-4-hydroxy-6-hydroxymethyldihydropteridine diphosphokinase